MFFHIHYVWWTFIPQKMLFSQIRSHNTRYVCISNTDTLNVRAMKQPEHIYALSWSSNIRVHNRTVMSPVQRLPSFCTVSFQDVRKHDLYRREDRVQTTDFLYKMHWWRIQRCLFQKAKGTFFALHTTKPYGDCRRLTTVILYAGTRWMWVVNFTP